MPLQLPDFPWDELGPAKAAAQNHPDGLIDLSVGSPVDHSPSVAQDALRGAADSPGYPTAWGSRATREVLARWWREQRNATAVRPDGVMPTVGSKEMVGLLPLLVGLGRSDTVVIPEIAYPTYAVGAQLVGAAVVAEDDPARWPDEAALVWINSPSNPTGEVKGVDYLRRAVSRAREIESVLASDECYALLGSPARPTSPSLLDDEATDGDLSGLVALYSLSKQSHLAGYRAAMVAGDPALIQQLLLPRRHLGLIVPEPIQHALASVLSHPEDVEAVRETYQRRRAIVEQALRSAGWSIDGGDAGLYLWVSKGIPSMDAVEWFAQRGILVAPGHFYGAGGEGHVRVALTESDSQLEAAAHRITT